MLNPGELWGPNRLPPKGLACGCPKMLLLVCPKPGAEAPNAPPVLNSDDALAPNAPPVLKVKGKEDAALLAAKGCPNAPGEACVCPKMLPPTAKEELVEPKPGVLEGKRLGVVDGPKTLAADDCPNAPPKVGLPNGAAEVCRAKYR